MTGIIKKVHDLWVDSDNEDDEEEEQGGEEGFGRGVCCANTSTINGSSDCCKGFFYV